MSLLKTQIRIVKRNQHDDSKEQPQAEPTCVEQRTTIIVKKWIAELKERKLNQKHSFPALPLVGSKG